MHLFKGDSNKEVCFNNDSSKLYFYALGYYCFINLSGVFKKGNIGECF